MAPRSCKGRPGPEFRRRKGDAHVQWQQATSGCPGQEVRINGDRINGLFHLLVNGSYIGVSNYPLMLTFDPNFLPGTAK